MPFRVPTGKTSKTQSPSVGLYGSGRAVVVGATAPARSDPATGVVWGFGEMDLTHNFLSFPQILPLPHLPRSWAGPRFSLRVHLLGLGSAAADALPRGSRTELGKRGRGRIGAGVTRAQPAPGPERPESLRGVGTPGIRVKQRPGSGGQRSRIFRGR